MAIGDGNYGRSENSNNNRLYENTYYSRVNFRSEDDKQLSIWYRSGLMVLEISQIDPSTYKRNPLGNIYLSPIKATMLASEVSRFKEYLKGDDVKENVAFGVTGGMKEKVSYIGFSTNEDREVIITIGKFDENGKIVEANTVKLKKDYNYSIEWKDISTMDLERVFDNDVELNMLHMALAEFSKSMNGAAAYSSADLNRYENERMLKKFDPIYDKLGIERRSYGGNSGGGNNDFLSNSGSSTRSTSVEEIGDLL